MKLHAALAILLLFTVACDNAGREKVNVEGTISFSLEGENFEFIKYDESSSSSNDPFGAAVCQVISQDNTTITQIFGKRFIGDEIEEIVVSIPYQATGTWDQWFYDPDLGTELLPRYLFLSAAWDGKYARADFDYRFKEGEFELSITSFEGYGRRITGTFSGTLLIHEKDMEGNWVLPEENIQQVTINEGHFDVKIYQAR